MIYTKIMLWFLIMLLKYEDQRYGFKMIYAMYENVKKKKKNNGCK